MQHRTISTDQFIAVGWWTLASGLLFLIASLGLARLQEWARLLFLVLVGAAIVLNLLGLMGLALVDSMMQNFAAEIGDPEFARSASLIVFSGYFLTILTVILFGWLMWRLTRPDVLALFGTETG